MTLHRAIADQVRIFFEDGTSTVFPVLDDEEIQDAIVEHCERHGWGLSEVEDYTIEGTVYADDLGVDNA